MENQSLDTLPKKIKEFWNKPEGTVSKVIFAGAIALIGFVLYKILPIIIVLTQNTIIAVVLIALLCLITYSVWNLKDNFMLWYKMMMSKLFDEIIDRDPITAARLAIANGESMYEGLNEKVARLNGSRIRLSKEIKSNVSEIERQLTYAKAAKAQDQEILQFTNKAGRLKEQNVRYGTMLDQTEKLYRALNKMQRVVRAILDDNTELINEKEQERKVMQESYGAIQNAKSIAGMEKNQLWVKALESIESDLSFKFGEVDKFLTDSESMIQKFDLENDVLSQEGEKMLAELDQKVLLLTSGSVQPVNFEVVDNREKVPVKRKSSTDDDDLNNILK